MDKQTPTGRPLRTTRQRRAVVAAIQQLDTFASTQTVHERMKSQGEEIGLSTVYRNLQALADAGEVDFLRNQDGEVLYRRCGDVHHHHLVCRTCGRAEELSGTAVERWVSRVASEHAFTDVSHEIEIFGLCPRCAGGAEPSADTT